MQFEDFSLNTNVLHRSDQRLKKNNNDELLPAHLQELYLLVKELGLMLNQKFIRPSLTSVKTTEYSYSSDINLEKKMEQLNSGESKTISIKTWQEEEKIHFNTVLTYQDKKFFISMFFKVIQDAISSCFTHDNVTSGRLFHVH